MDVDSRNGAGRGGTPAQLVAAVLWLLAGAGALVVAARALGWQAGPLYFVVALTPYVGVGLVLVTVAAAVLRARVLTVVALALALVVAWWWWPAFRGSPATGPPLGISVMTTNLRFGYADPQAVVAAVQAGQVDLLSVQELTPEAVRGLTAAGLDRLLPHRFVSVGEGSSPASGTGIWSRYPIGNRADTDDLVFENLAVTVTLPSGPVSFFAVHPVPPSPTDGNHGREVFDAVRDFVNSRPGPAIAAGDFNATRDNVPIRHLVDDGWSDAGTAAGAGMVRTWPDDRSPLPPLVALDHVMTRDCPSATAVGTVDIPGTDHRAVIARL